MFHSLATGVTHFVSYVLSHYGYWVPLVFVMIESLGIPFPGETAVIAASVYARESHRLDIVLVIFAAAAGAIIGDNIGYWIGRTGGYHVAHKHAKLFHLNDRRLTYGVYLFKRHGPALVFWGRFITLLRMWAALLAGANCMEWRRFVIFNALGGVVWSAFFGVLAFELGNDIHVIETWLNAGFWLLFGGTLVAMLVYFFRNEERLEDEAERELSPKTKERIATET